MFYDKFIRLCSEKGIAPTRAAEDIGLTGGAVSYWKSKGNRPTDDTITKIAKYFEVPVSYFSEQKEADALTKALLALWEDMSDKEKNAVFEHANIIRKLR